MNIKTTAAVDNWIKFFCLIDFRKYSYLLNGMLGPMYTKPSSENGSIRRSLYLYLDQRSEWPSSLPEYTAEMKERSLAIIDFNQDRYHILIDPIKG